MALVSNGIAEPILPPSSEVHGILLSLAQLRPDRPDQP